VAPKPADAPPLLEVFFAVSWALKLVQGARDDQ
jgi:hypothetical protein